MSLSKTKLFGCIAGHNPWTDSVLRTASFGVCPMKRIYLTQDQVTLVDDEDYEWLNQWKWYAKRSKSDGPFYAVRYENIGGKQCCVSMHRQILGLGYGDKRQGDHKRHNTLDNRRSQLRVVTNQQNNFNRCGAKGFYYNKRVGRYEGYIIVNDRKIYLGLYSTTKQAGLAYLEAKKKYHRIRIARERLYV